MPNIYHLPPEIIKNIGLRALVDTPSFDFHREIQRKYNRSEAIISGMQRVRRNTVEHLIEDNPDITDEELDEALEQFDEYYVAAEIQRDERLRQKGIADRSVHRMATNITLGLGRLLPESRLRVPRALDVTQVGPGVPLDEPPGPLLPGMAVAYPL